MTLRDLPLYVVEALGYWDALRRLGFGSDDVYFRADPYPVVTAAGLGEDPRRMLARVILRTDGGEFLVDAAELTRAEGERFRDDMLAALPLLRSETVEDLTEWIWRRSRVGRDAGEFQGLIAALVARGFVPPELWRKVGN